MTEALVRPRIEEGTPITLGAAEAAKLLRAGRLVRPTFWRGTMVALKLTRASMVKVYGHSASPSRAAGEEMLGRITSPVLDAMDLFHLEEELLDVVRYRAWGIEVDDPKVAREAMQAWEEVDYADLDAEYEAEQADIRALRWTCLRCRKNVPEKLLKLAKDDEGGMKQMCLECRLEIGDPQAAMEKALMEFHD